jgi:hypothetical protein
MRLSHFPLPLAAAVLLHTLSSGSAATNPQNDSASLPSGELLVLPAKIELSGAKDQQQILAFFASDQTVAEEATETKLAVEDPSIASLDSEGVLRPKKDGTTRIIASLPGKTAFAEVHVREASRSIEWSFDRQILPILTKGSCNTGGCHGALAGKGGFRLSLAGYDPESDFYNIVRDSNGRRVEPSDPLTSILLMKPTVAIPHKGGRRLSPRSDDYRVLAEWIADGMTGPEPAKASLKSIEVAPAQVRAKKGARLRFLVTAHYTDGTRQDVTRWTRFNSADETVAKVDEPTGRVDVIGSGEGAITAWFSSRIVMARVTAPNPGQIRKTGWSAIDTKNPIDKAVLAHLRKLNIAPSDECNDATFVRRAFLDTIGLLPTADEAEAFVKNPSNLKRSQLVDSLLSRAAYVDYWSYRFSDVFLINGSHLRPDAVKSYYQWLHGAVASNRPWDQMVREVLTSRGENLSEGATNFFAVHQDPETMAENVSQAFLGLSINCAKCHNHPLEKWTNDQYYAFANLFARVRAKGWGGDNRNGNGARTLFLNTNGELLQPRTGQPQPPTPLDGTPIAFDDPKDRREYLADWLTAPSNPYFTRAIANRVWAAFLGTGIVTAVDDLRMSNPASNQELMDVLCAFLVENKYDLKALMRLILTSATYQRSSEANDSNVKDSKHFSHYYPRRLMAEVLSDAITGATGVPEKFDAILMNDGEAQKTDFYPEGTRATQLYDAAVKSYFLKAFGRNQREITCECERSNQPSLVQALHLSNGSTINERIAAPKGRLTELLEKYKSPSALIKQLFLTTLSRMPTFAEHETYSAALADQRSDSREVAEDILWALLTSREFLFQH